MSVWGCRKEGAQFHCGFVRKRLPIFQRAVEMMVHVLKGKAVELEVMLEPLVRPSKYSFTQLSSLSFMLFSLFRIVHYDLLTLTVRTPSVCHIILRSSHQSEFRNILCTLMSVTVFNIILTVASLPLSLFTFIFVSQDCKICPSSASCFEINKKEIICSHLMRCVTRPLIYPGTAS